MSTTAATSQITVTANGKILSVPAAMPLAEFVKEQGLAIERVVVERNREALTPSEARNTLLADGDQLEIVRIVAGG